MASGDQPGVGVYTVVVEATDGAGNTAIERRLLVIYNMEGGFPVVVGPTQTPVPMPPPRALKAGEVSALSPSAK